MEKAIYTGFSTFNWGKRRTTKLVDLELVKRDLLNHIYTEVGTRVFMPSFGTRIPLLVFDQNDEQTRKIIEEDLLKVFNYDPRVKVLSLNVMSLTDNNAIVALAELLYIELNIKDTLRIEVTAK